MLKIRLMGTKNDITWFKKIHAETPKGRGSGNVRPLSQTREQINITDRM